MKSALVIEDDPSLQELLKAMLERHFRTLDLAWDGEQALARLADSSYDLVVLDLMLPKVNGFEVAAKIQALPSPPKLIVLSALSRYFEDRFPPGTVVLQKPYDIDKIDDALRAVHLI
jgi:twitching motility two-component system response regulator PilH